jgi:hypothetical protein
MIEFQDAAGRLIVVLPMRMRHFGKRYCVFINGKSVAEFLTCREALAYARSLVPQGQTESLEPPSRSEGVEME